MGGSARQGDGQGSGQAWGEGDGAGDDEGDDENDDGGPGAKVYLNQDSEQR